MIRLIVLFLCFMHCENQNVVTFLYLFLIAKWETKLNQIIFIKGWAYYLKDRAYNFITFVGYS